MGTPLRVLIVEDSADDAELLVRNLRLGGYEPVSEVVDTEAQFLNALDRGGWDVILCDHALPQFNSLNVLHMLRKRGLDIPFVIVSGLIGEEEAVDAMRAGAQDYIMKGNLARLVPAIQRELREVGVRGERRRVEEERERLAAMVEATSDFVGVADGEGRALYLNAGARRMMGVALDADVSDLRLRELYPERIRVKIMDQALPDAMRAGAWQGETIMLRQDGREIPVSQVVLSHKAPDGTVRFLSTVARDISERQRAEEALRKAEELYRGLVEASGAWITRVNRQRERTFVTGAKSVLRVTPPDEATSPVFGSHVHPDDKGGFLATLERVFETGQPIYGRNHRVIFGEHVHHMSVNWEPIKDEEGNVVEVQLAGFDVTDQKLLEEQYYQAQKMESVGRLAGGVAHDFNNLLTAIIGFTEMGLLALPTESPARPYLEEVKGAGERAATLTRQLLTFSRRQPVQPKVFNLGELTSNMAKILRRLIGEDIELATRSALGLWKVTADPGQIEQVLVNLAVNARDAMPHGGNLLIEVANVTLKPDHVRQHGEVPPGDYVLLAITDTGAGMSEEIKAHLFEPFFTTKKQGTGLGLATCYGIVKQSGGHISICSELGKGTMAKVYLPRTADGAEEAPKSQDPVPSARGRETVLLVEDDPAVRSLSAGALRQLGYTVLEAANGDEALHVVHEHSATSIQLVLTDLVMPQMGGKQLAERLVAMRPDLKVAFMSGYADGAIAHNGMLEAGTTFLQKPFSRRALAQMVRGVLDK
ncbi:MAG: response regulator [Chloroflexi bacterium]|nr:response regulator [Chloroflexota bacterium]